MVCGYVSCGIKYSSVLVVSSIRQVVLTDWFVYIVVAML